MKQQCHVIIIGGGASGMTAAIAAARSGASVTVLEQKDRLGKKLLSTGNGKCNFTNEYMETSCFRSEDPSIIASVLSQFGTTETLAFFEELGLLYKNRQGYYYPRCEQASAVLELLTLELERLHVRVLCDTTVTNISKRKDFLIHTDNGTFHADCIILATGGKASPVLGSDGSGYALAKNFGHTICPVVPALVQLHGKGTFFKMISGVRTEARVSLFVNDELLASDCGELQLTQYGISGIPVFQVSRYAALALYRKEKPIAVIDFLPEYEETELAQFLQQRAAKQPSRRAEEFLIGMFNQKLIPLLLCAAGIPKEASLNELRPEQFDALAHKCKAFSIEITATNPFEQAQICAGGVSTSEVCPTTLESHIVKGLYLTGELLDVDGICGGYNLQWAWATGYLAGCAAAKGL